MAAIAIAALAAIPLCAASRVTVQQLAGKLASARAGRNPDDEIAHGIARLELKERLTKATLSGLAREAGEHTRVALQTLADRSAFLDPPAAEIPPGEPPAPAEQRAMLARAEAYTLNYVRVLPNLVCTQIVHRSDDMPSAHGPQRGVLHPSDTITGELTVRDGKESFELRTVNGAPYQGPAPAPIGKPLRADQQPAMGLTTSGEFGSVLALLFAGPARKFTWRHWETFDGKRVAVFGYSVPRSDSRFTVSWCCGREPDGRLSLVDAQVACQGELFIEPASGAIVRVTSQALYLPRSFPIQRSDTAVEYGPVSLAGMSWLGPVRSLTVVDELYLDQPYYIGLQAQGLGALDVDPNQEPRKNIAPRVHRLNQVEYSDYHKFGADSRLEFGPPVPNPAPQPPAPR